MIFRVISLMVIAIELFFWGVITKNTHIFVLAGVNLFFLVVVLRKQVFHYMIISLHFFGVIRHYDEQTCVIALERFFFTYLLLPLLIVAMRQSLLVFLLGSVSYMRALFVLFTGACLSHFAHELSIYGLVWGKRKVDLIDMLFIFCLLLIGLLTFVYRYLPGGITLFGAVVVGATVFLGGSWLAGRVYQQKVAHMLLFFCVLLVLSFLDLSRHAIQSRLDEQTVTRVVYKDRIIYLSPE